MNVLYFDRNGYCVCSMRLERGCFQHWWAGAEKMALDSTRLKLLFEGINLREKKQCKRFSHTQSIPAGI